MIKKISNFKIRVFCFLIIESNFKSDLVFDLAFCPEKRTKTGFNFCLTDLQFLFFKDLWI